MAKAATVETKSQIANQQMAKPSQEPSAAPKAVKVQATAAAPPEPKRKDQFQCPLCQHWGCPAAGGTPRRRTFGIIRYRKCSNPRCRMGLFRTLTPHPTPAAPEPKEAWSPNLGESA